MRFKRVIYLSTILLFSWIAAYSQIQIKVCKGEKKIYSVGDKISLNIKLKTLPETCADGLKRAKVYVAGLNIDTQTEWRRIGIGLWSKQIEATFVDNKKKAAKITITRVVDKESLFKQAEFQVQ